MKTLLFVSAAALLAIVALLPPSFDAKEFTKCELASRLKAEIPQMGHEGNKKIQEILAKVICQVETTTGFNTSAISPAGPPKIPFDKIPKKNKGKGSHEKTAEPDNDKDHKPHVMPSRDFGDLLGIFQLPSQLVCNNTKSLCKLDCSKLLDDDITDDIACMKFVFQFKGKGPQFGEHCSRTNMSAYLSECNL
ncbi:lysozyme C-like [Acipenser oxyrinchus oxyrinchus]|uniref:Lysozyme C-like n=1 Tax=Acipenser oxyrinchus oxyrinchus TaxID=40147 RepID=A0AAD8GC62_ACIOX|nr:lysozyme C-like [Acipenser oxyrinchus oxyrinchus]